MYRIGDYVKLKKPAPGKPYRPEILFPEHKAKSLGGMLALLVPGSRVPYHHHKIVSP